MRPDAADLTAPSLKLVLMRSLPDTKLKSRREVSGSGAYGHPDRIQVRVSLALEKTATSSGMRAMKSTVKTIHLGPLLIGFLILSVLAIPAVRHGGDGPQTLRADVTLMRR